MRLVFMGSGAFGLPTLERLLERHDVALVVTQPDRPAGRGRHPIGTPIAGWADGVAPLVRSENVNDPEFVARLRALRPDVLVVVAFGQKLGAPLLEGLFAINLHGSLLPRHRGAAPINWTLLAGDELAGVTVITLAQRMDAGAMLGTASTPVDPLETAGELHDRLAVLGAPLILDTLERHREGTLTRCPQDESLATRAAKLSRADAWIRFEDDVIDVRRRVHALTPWPGVSIRIGAHEVRLLRVRSEPEPAGSIGTGRPGTLASDGRIACHGGAIRILEVQPAGGRPMDWAAFVRGRPVEAGTIVTSSVPPRDA